MYKKKRLRLKKRKRTTTLLKQSIRVIKSQPVTCDRKADYCVFCPSNCHLHLWVELRVPHCYIIPSFLRNKGLIARVSVSDADVTRTQSATTEKDRIQLLPAHMIPTRYFY